MLVLPSFFYSSIGAAVAVQIGTFALGLGREEGWARVLMLAGLGVFVLVAAVQLARFRRRNGVWIGGLASRVVLGTANLTSVTYTAALAGGIWAALADAWWLVPVAAVLGGVVYAWCGRRWWRNYQGDPDQRGRDDSTLLLILLPVLVAVGLVALLVEH